MNNPEYVKVNDKKYKINTDFRVAIQCNKIAQDTTINDTERAMAIIYKLYGDEGLNNSDDYQRLLDLGLKYLSMGEEVKDSKDEPDMDLIQDMPLIEASFMYDYNTDISKTNMHWWDFLKLLNGLSYSEFGNCCILNRVRNIRNTNLSEIKDNKARENMAKLQQRYALKKKEKQLTEEQRKSAEDLYRSLGIDIN